MRRNRVVYVIISLDDCDYTVCVYVHIHVCIVSREGSKKEKTHKNIGTVHIQKQRNGPSKNMTPVKACIVYSSVVRSTRKEIAF